MAENVNMEVRVDEMSGEPEVITPATTSTEGAPEGGEAEIVRESQTFDRGQGGAEGFNAEQLQQAITTLAQQNQQLLNEVEGLKKSRMDVQPAPADNEPSMTQLRQAYIDYRDDPEKQAYVLDLMVKKQATEIAKGMKDEAFSEVQKTEQQRQYQYYRNLGDQVLTTIPEWKSSEFRGAVETASKQWGFTDHPLGNLATALILQAAKAESGNQAENRTQGIREVKNLDKTKRPTTVETEQLTDDEQLVVKRFGITDPKLFTKFAR